MVSIKYKFISSKLRVILKHQPGPNKKAPILIDFEFVLSLVVVVVVGQHFLVL